MHALPFQHMSVDLLSDPFSYWFSRNQQLLTMTHNKMLSKLSSLNIRVLNSSMRRIIEIKLYIISTTTDSNLPWMMTKLRKGMEYERKIENLFHKRRNCYGSFKHDSSKLEAIKTQRVRHTQASIAKCHPTLEMQVWIPQDPNHFSEPTTSEHTAD